MTTLNGRFGGAWCRGCGLFGDAGGMSAAWTNRLLDALDRPIRLMSVASALMICVGLVSSRQSPAAETLTLQGPFPRLTFDDNDGVLQMWDIAGDHTGFDVFDLTAGVGNTSPFHIDPASLDNSLYINNAGAVGFGTALPGASLHVSTGGLQPTLRLQTTNIAGARAWDLRGSGGRFDLVDVTNGNATPFGVQAGAPTDTVYLTSGGKVGFGTTAPDANSQVDIRSGLNNGLFLRRAAAGVPHYVRVETNDGVFRSGVQGNGDAQFGALTAGKGLNLIAGGTTKLLMNSTGQITFGNTPTAISTHALLHSSGANLTLAGVWTNASSRALKQDIEPITSEQARDTVRALQPVGYRYKSEPAERYVGFIAEDVPELVATNDRKGLAPMDITAVLTKVVQDQSVQLDAQKSQLEDQRIAMEKQLQLNKRQEQLLAEQQTALATLMKRLEAIERR